MVIQSTIQVSAEEYYSCELTRRIPVRVSIVTINGDAGFAIVETLTDNDSPIQEYVDELRAEPTTQELEVTYRSPKAYWTRLVHRLDRDSIHTTILQSGCMSRLPIVVESGIQRHVVLAPSRERLSSLLKELRRRFTNVEIRRMQSIPTGTYHIPLTEKQKTAFQHAFNSGYYDIPRKCTLSELGSDLGIKRVAMQERLRRVEYRLMQEFAELIL